MKRKAWLLSRPDRETGDDEVGEPVSNATVDECAKRRFAKDVARHVYSTADPAPIDQVAGPRPGRRRVLAPLSRAAHNFAVPSGVAPEKALADNRQFKVVWQVLNALRADKQVERPPQELVDLVKELEDNRGRGDQAPDLLHAESDAEGGKSEGQISSNGDGVART
jgi:hypothetical protein